MWYEKGPVVWLVNFVALIIISVILFYSFGYSSWKTWLILGLIILSNLYNSYITYNRAIDITVKLLGKHYENKVTEEIKKAIKKVMEF
jgi:hypothetical protein